MPTFTIAIDSVGTPDYDSIQDALNTEETNLMSGIYTFECYADDYTSAGTGGDGYNSYSSQVTVSTQWATVSGTQYVEITTPSGHRHNGKPYASGTNPSGYGIRRTGTGAFTHALRNYVDYTRFTGLVIMQACSPYTGKLDGIYCDSDNYVRVSYNIVVSEVTSTYSNSGIHFRSGYLSSNEMFAYNNLICTGDNGSSYGWTTGIAAYQAARLVCNTVVDSTTQCYYGGVYPTTSPQMYDCVGFAASGSFHNGSWSAGSHNASSTGTVYGTSGQTSITKANDFNDAANLDYSPKSSSTKLVDTGTNDPKSQGFTDDLAGNTRTATWDIGALEYVVAGTTISITKDTLSYSGKAFNLAEDLIIVKDSFTYSGKAFTVSTSTILSISVDSLTYSGKAFNIAIDETISITKDTLNYAGQNFNLLSGQYLEIASASLTYSGKGYFLSETYLINPAILSYSGKQVYIFNSGLSNTLPWQKLHLKLVSKNLT